MTKTKKTLLAALTLMAAVAAPAGASTINISTGVAGWQVFIPGTGFTAATVAQQNGTWAPAPAGSSWVSFGAIQGTSCVVGQTPGNGCASTLFNASGDIWSYALTISAAALGATSGSLSFVFGADNNVNLFVGNNSSGEGWGPSQTDGFNPLGCSGGPTSAGNTQATYNNCTTTTPFSAANLNGDGSLTLSAFVQNNAIPNCPACGDPTGFVLAGAIVTGSPTPVPEPASFVLVGATMLGTGVLRRRRRPV